jgi:hypothetical protein
MGWKMWDLIPERAKNLFFPHPFKNIWKGYGAHPAFY